MKSINQESKKIIYLVAGVLIVLFILLVYFTLFSITLSSESKKYRFILSSVNSIIKELYDYEKLTLDQEKSVQIKKINTKNNELTNNLSLYNVKNFTPVSLDINLIWSNDDVHSLVKEYGDIARSMSDRFQSVRFKITVVGIVSLVISLVSTFAVLLVVIYFRSTFTNFSKSVNHSLNSFYDFLNYSSDSIVIKKSSWKEEDQINKRMKIIESQINSDRKISEAELMGTLEAFLPEIMNVIEGLNIPCDRVAVAFIDNFDNVIAESAQTKLDKIFLDPGFTEPIKSTTLSDMIKSKKPRIINDLENHYLNVNRSVSTKKILDEGIRSNLTFPIFIKEKCIGFVFISSSGKNSYKEEHINYASKAILLIKQSIYYHFIVQQIIAETTSAFITLMEKKDNETAFHILRMSRYSYIIAKKLFSDNKSITPKFIREISWFAPLHDIGKIGIPDSVLLKPDKLLKEEFDIMKNHVTIGADIIKNMDEKLSNIFNVSILNTALEIIMGHHEKYDGSGYPLGLSKEDIPLAGRIIAVADVFDALSSRRPYKDAFSFDTSLDMVKKGAGTHFDPIVVDAFCDSIDEVKKIYNKYREV